MTMEAATGDGNSFDGRLFEVPNNSYDENVQVILARLALLYPGQQLYFPKEGSVNIEVDKKIIIDYQRIDEVLTILTQALENELYPYNLDSVRIPQDPRHMPETLELGSKDHAMFLFTACYYMRGGIKSVEAIKKLARMYDAHPELFDASYAKNLDPESLVPILTTYGLGFQVTVSNQWVNNSKIMDELWDGNPVNIYKDISSYQPCVDRIANKRGNQGFWGFQEKMVSMLTYYLMDEGMVSYFDFPPPVDLHLMRVSIANELIKFEGYGEHEDVYSEEMLEIMRGYFYDYAVKNQINVLRLADAVWLLSQSLCGNQPGNVTLEPLGRKNRPGRSAFLIAKPIDISDPKQRADYQRTCGSCPIEPTCKYNVPGKYYFVQGRLFRRGERVRFPQIPANITKAISFTFEEDN